MQVTIQPALCGYEVQTTVEYVGFLFWAKKEPLKIGNEWVTLHFVLSVVVKQCSVDYVPSMFALVPAGSSKLHPFNDVLSMMAHSIFTPRRLADCKYSNKTSTSILLYKCTLKKNKKNFLN